MLADSFGPTGFPFIVALSNEEFTKPLTLFHRLIAYSNVRFDVSVHYSTAAIRRNPFVPTVDISTLAIPAVLLDDSVEVPPEEKEVAVPDAFELKMLTDLIKLPWKRYAVIPGRPMLAHVDIIIKSVFWSHKHGFPIIAHLLDHFRFKNVTSTLSEVPKETLELKNVHLIVLVHGLDDVAHDMLPLAEAIRDEFPRPLFKVVIPTCNDGKTGDGIVDGSMRLFRFLKLEILNMQPAKISFIADSVGGLYCRMLVGLLHGEGYIPRIQPMNFITIGTQHLGSRRNLTDWPISKYLRSLMSTTGRQLNMLDLEPQKVLVFLASNDYVQPLKLFRNLILYANVRSTQYSYYSTCIVSMDEQPDFEQFPHKHPRIVAIKNVNLQGSESLENSIASSLGILDWKRFAIIPATSILSNQFDYWTSSPKHPIVPHIVHQLLQ